MLTLNLLVSQHAHLFDFFVQILVLVQGNNDPRNDQYDRSVDSSKMMIFEIEL